MDGWETYRRRVEFGVSLSDGRGRETEESPDSTGRGCWITSRRGDPTESAAESRPPMARSGTGKGETVV